MCNPAPLAPQFVSTLQETAQETVITCLKSIQAPVQLIELVQNMQLLGEYLQAVEHSPILAKNIGIEELTIQTINLISQSGGVFHSPTGATIPQEMQS